MYKNQFIKFLERGTHDWKYARLTRVMGSGSIGDKIKEQSEVLLSHLPTSPCFYIGDVELNEISEGVGVVKVDGSDRISWDPAYEHIPFREMCICGKLMADTPEGPQSNKILINLQATSQDQMVHYQYGIRDWCINTVLLLMQHNGEEKLLYFPLTVCVTDQIVEDAGVKKDLMYYFLDTAPNISDVQQKAIEDTAKLALHVACYMLRLLSCKNAVVVKESMGGRKPNPKRPELDYNVIKIKLNKQQRFIYKGREVTEFPFHEREKYGIDRTCRGHFKTYGTGDRGLLFGKLAGTWWWSDRFGVKRDYELIK